MRPPSEGVRPPSQYYGTAPQPDLEGSFNDFAATDETKPLLEDSPKVKVIDLPDSVYTAILLLPAISRLKTGTKEGVARWKETNKPARLALMLVCFNALLQAGMVQVIGVYGHYELQAETRTLLLPEEVADYGDHPLSKTDEDVSHWVIQSHGYLHKQSLLPNEKKDLEAVEAYSPLCRREKGRLDCAPNSVKFVQEWKLLDTDGDGIWTIEEAKADTAKLREKHHGVSPETIFNNLISGLRTTRTFMERKGGNNTFYLTPDVDNNRAIPKAYFNYWAGDAMMCSFFDSNSCEGVAKDGVFAEALRPGRVSAGAKGIESLDSAIEYCYRLLSTPGGFCETLLPIEFKSNREQRWARCGESSLGEGGTYTNPYNPDQKVHTLRAAYSNLTALQRATSRLFLFFMCLIIVLWFLALIDEWSDLLKYGEFLCVYPGIAPGALGGQVIEGEEDTDGHIGTAYRITGLSKTHRALLVVIYLVRILVAVMLLTLGTRFLLVQTSYIDLVLNSLALTFILEIDTVLYLLLEKDTVADVHGVKKIRFRTRLPIEGVRGYVLKRECWGLFLIPIMSVGLVLYFNSRDKLPVQEALTCACIQEGGNCLDAVANQATWWKDYWGHILPSAMHQIAGFRMMAST